MRRKKAGRILISLLGVLLLFATLPFTGHTAVPQKINYQGYLTDADGVPVDGTVQMTFSIYDVDIDGTALWTETQSSVTVNNGVYSVVLGSVDPTGNPLNLPFDTQYYLGVEVGTDDEMTPRQPLTSVPYAMNADTAEFAIDVADDVVTSSKIAAGAVTSAQIGDGSVAGADVGFNYADSNSKGGPAVDVDCVGCVSSGELDFSAGDGHSLDAADGSPADAVYVDNDGNVGIGTSTPDVRLDVKGGFNVTPGTYYYSKDDTLSGHLPPRCSCDSGILNDCQDGFYTDLDEQTTCYDWTTITIFDPLEQTFYDLEESVSYDKHPSAPVALSIQSSGILEVDRELRVGLGTIIRDSSIEALGYSGNAVYGSTHTGNGVLGYSIDTGTGVKGYSYNGRGVHGRSINGTAGYFWSESGDGLIVAGGNLLAYDNVGIHTSSPGEELSIDGNVMIGSESWVQGTTTGDLAIEGNVGIGTTSPEAKLDVAGGDDSFAWGGDHSSSDYIRIGNLQICWGSAVLTGSDHQRSFNFTFPAPFNETPKITNGINAVSSGYAYAVFDHSVSTTGYSGSMVEIDFRSSSTNVTMNYMAIGTWQ